MKGLLTGIVIATLICTAMPASAQLVFSDGSSMSTTVYDKTVVVKADGTDTANGTALLSALSGISDAAANNRYVLQLEAGTYNLGSSTLDMKAFVDLQGAGPNSTTITSAAGSMTLRVSGLASKVAVSSLEVANTATTGANAICIWVIASEAEFYRVLATPSGTISRIGFVASDIDLSRAAGRSSGPLASFGDMGGGSARGGATPADVSLINCSVVDSGATSDTSEGIVVIGRSTLSTAVVFVSVSGSSVANRGIEVSDDASAILRLTEVHAGPATSSGALTMFGGNSFPHEVATFFCFLEGDIAIETSGGFNTHVSTGFDGTRFGFMDGIDAWFSSCYDLSTGVPIPLIDTETAIAP